MSGPNPQSPKPNPELDTLVRRADEDRWLASRFTSELIRQRLIALYAVNHELARIAESVREPGLGEIRLQWWRDAFESILQGYLPGTHPVIDAFNQTMPYTWFAQAMQSIADARSRDLDPTPFADWAEVDRYIDATAGTLMRAAMDLCGSAIANGEQGAVIAAAARAWGYTGLLRSIPHWRARNASPLPVGATEADMRARAEAAYSEAKAGVRMFKAEAFAAYGYVALVPGYLRALSRGASETPLLGRKVLLIGASATGRI